MPPATRPLWQTALFFASMVAILVFANQADPREAQGFFATLFAIKWPLTAAAATMAGLISRVRPLAEPWRPLKLRLLELALI